MRKKDQKGQYTAFKGWAVKKHWALTGDLPDGRRLALFLHNRRGIHILDAESCLFSQARAVMEAAGVDGSMSMRLTFKRWFVPTFLWKWIMSA